MLTFNEQMDDYEIFLKALSVAKNKPKFLSEKKHKILSPFNTEDNVFMKHTMLSQEDFFLLLSNPHSEMLLNTTDKDGVTCLEKNSNDLYYFVKKNKDDFIRKYLRIISNFNCSNKEKSIEALIIAVLKEGSEYDHSCNKGKVYNLLNGIKELKMNEVKINWTKVMSKIKSHNNYYVSSKEIRNHLLSVYSSGELDDWLCIYSSDSVFINKTLESKKEVKEIEILRERLKKRKTSFLFGYSVLYEEEKIKLIDQREKELIAENEKNIIKNNINSTILNTRTKQRRI